MSHLHAYFTGVLILFYARCTVHSYKFQSLQRTAKSLNFFLSQNEKGLFVSIHTVTKRSWTIVNMHFRGTQAWHFFNIFLQKPKPYGPKGLQHEIFNIQIWFGRDLRLLNISAYAQPAMKSISRMLIMDFHVKTVHILPLAEHAREFVPRMLSVRWNHFLVPRMLSHRKNVRTSKFWVKSKERSEIFSKIYQGHKRIWFLGKIFKIISCLCTFKLYNSISKVVYWKMYGNAAAIKTLLFSVYLCWVRALRDILKEYEHVQ
jgi:hypothetical protein